MFPEWTWIVGLFVGAVMGSFMNMCIHRLPRGLSLSNPPRSFCPACKHPLGAADLVPLFSWLFLRGRCRYCKAPIHARYFIVELINGSLWAWLWWQYLIVGWNPALGIAYAVFGSSLFIALVTDLEHYIIPDEINAILLFAGFAYHGIFGNIMTAVWGALVGWGMLWGVALLGRVAFGKDAMGHGDIKMARGMGAMLGPLLVVAAFFIAVFAGAIGGVIQILLRKKGGVSDERPVPPSASAGMAQIPSTSDDEYVPESIGSLIQCGLGYLLLIDVIALAAPKVGLAWFGEEEMSEDEIDDWTPQPTAIPFGPYLAFGAIVSVVFAQSLTRFMQDYFNPAGGQAATLEHLISAGGHKIG